MQSHTFAQGLNGFAGLVKLHAKESWGGWVKCGEEAPYVDPT